MLPRVNQDQIMIKKRVTYKLEW